jgi:hypothetical protein
MELQFNGTAIPITSLEQLGTVFDECDLASEFELWVSVDRFPSMCMLRNGNHAWLMHVRGEDKSAHSIGKYEGNDVCCFRLANGQLDEYPLSWCIDIEQCYKAIAYFYVNHGARL